MSVNVGVWVCMWECGCMGDCGGCMSVDVGAGVCVYVCGCG